MSRRIHSLVVLAIVIAASVAANAATTGRFERTLQVPSTVDLDIATGSGNITVKTGPAGSVHIIGNIRSNSFFGGGEERVRQIEQNPPISQTGGIIRIGRSNDSNLMQNISISYELVVPAETVLKSSTGSGDQNISGLQTAIRISAGSGALKINNIGGAVRASTGSGNIDIADITGAVNAQTGSGEINLRNAGAVELSTGSGKIEATGVRGGAHAKTGSGDIHVNGEATAPWQLHTGSGDVKVQLKNTKFDLDANTSSGNIAVGPQVAVERQDRHHMRGKVNGGGTLLEIQTSSGDIDVR